MTASSAGFINEHLFSFGVISLWQNDRQHGFLDGH
jgi:hypothetical protein